MVYDLHLDLLSSHKPSLHSCQSGIHAKEVSLCIKDVAMGRAAQITALLLSDPVWWPVA